MRDPQTPGFGQFVPGFDFLQNLAKGAAGGLPQMPNLASWVAPTLDVKELEKRISDLKAVHFWLDQNGKALAATIQALEVQKMTLATLQGMNLDLGQMADALKVKPAPSPAPAPAAARPRPARKTAPPPSAPPAAAGQPPVDPLQWWGALTRQFQDIAATALQDVAQQMPQAPAAPAAKAAAAAKKKPAARKTRKA